MSTLSFIYLAFLHFCSFKRPGFLDSHLPCFHSKHLGIASILIHLDFTTAPETSATVFPFSLVVQLPSHVRLSMTPWTTACQASLSPTISWDLPKFMSIGLVMPSNQLILSPTLEIRKPMHREVK